MSNTAISVSDLSKKYDDRLAVSHINFEVPLGTVAYDEESGEIEAEVLEDGQEVIWLKGGRGGLGNANFATPTNQAPDYAQPGEPGIEGWK